MTHPEVEIYLNQFVNFFEKNPNDLLKLVGETVKDEFFEKVKEVSTKNFKNFGDASLTQKQIIEIVVEIKKPTRKENKKIESVIFSTKFGDIVLN
jgi:hypothetical protein